MADNSLVTLSAPPQINLAPPVAPAQGVVDPSTLSSALPQMQIQSPQQQHQGFLQALFSQLHGGQPTPDQQQAQDLYRTAQQGPPGLAGLLPAGGLRNVIGNLWDAHLMHEGQAPVYHNWQQSQLESNAELPMAGVGLDPQTGQAVANLMKVDPEAGRQLHAQLIQAQLAANERQRQMRMTDSQIQDKALGISRAMFNGATPQNYPVLKAQAEKYLSGQGVDPALLALPDQYDPDQVRAITQGAVPVARYQQNTETARHHGVEEGIGQQNANSNSTKAGAAVVAANAQGGRASAAQQQAGTGAARLQADIQGGKTGPNTVHGGGGHHIFGGGAAAPTPANLPPVGPKNAVKYGSDGSRLVSDGTKWIYHPKGA